MPRRKFDPDTNPEDIFREYIKMGNSRSLRRLAAKTDIPVGTLAKWSKTYGWIERLERILGDAKPKIIDDRSCDLKPEEIGAILARPVILEKTIDVGEFAGEVLKTPAEQKIMSRKINQALKAGFFEEVKRGSARIKNIKEYIELDKHDMLLRGEATERKEVFTLSLSGQAKDLLEQIGRKIALEEDRDIEAEAELEPVMPTAKGQDDA